MTIHLRARDTDTTTSWACWTETVCGTETVNANWPAALSAANELAGLKQNSAATRKLRRAKTEGKRVETICDEFQNPTSEQGFSGKWGNGEMKKRAQPNRREV